MRKDGRTPNQLRKILLTPNVSEYAEGSCLVEFGKTKVLCTATYDAQAPKWLQGTGRGWVTAEYGMLPRSTQTRIKRDKAAESGRTQEISRLIGRSLRAAVDLTKIPDKQITVDCDVLHADGGTRTAAVTGGFVALALAFEKLQKFAEIRDNPLQNYISAVSIGLQEGEPLVDLNYDEDSAIGTDMNFVMTDQSEFIEVQGTAEHKPFNIQQLQMICGLAQKACGELFAHQEKIVGHYFKVRHA